LLCDDINAKQQRNSHPNRRVTQDIIAAGEELFPSTITSIGDDHQDGKNDNDNKNNDQTIGQEMMKKSEEEYSSDSDSIPVVVTLSSISAHEGEKEDSEAAEETDAQREEDTIIEQLCDDWVTTQFPLVLDPYYRK
jgi:hypothetical protein